MTRRELIALLGTTAAMWPLGARAQQSPTLRRIGVLNMFAADDPEGQARIAALLQALQPLGWTVGRNLRIDYRWGTSNIATTHKNAAELVALAPDVIVTNGAAGVAPLLDDRFRESCHKRGIHLSFQAPICVRGALRTKD